MGVVGGGGGGVIQGQGVDKINYLEVPRKKGRYKAV